MVGICDISLIVSISIGMTFSDSVHSTAAVVFLSQIVSF